MGDHTNSPGWRESLAALGALLGAWWAMGGAHPAVTAMAGAAGGALIAAGVARAGGQPGARAGWIGAGLRIGWAAAVALAVLPQRTDIWPGIGMVAVAAGAGRVAGDVEGSVAGAVGWQERGWIALRGGIVALAVVNGGSARVGLIAGIATAAAALAGSAAPLPLLMLALIGHWYASLPAADLLALCLLLSGRDPRVLLIAGIWLSHTLPDLLDTAAAV